MYKLTIITNLFAGRLCSFRILALTLLISGCGDDRWDLEVLNNTNPLHPFRLQQIDLNGSVTMEMVWASAGSFTMGSPESEKGRQAGREKQHEVVLEKGFFLGKYEVTQLQYQAVMQDLKNPNYANPSHFKGARRPVEKVSGMMLKYLLNDLTSMLPARRSYLSDGTFVFRLNQNGNMPAVQEQNRLIPGVIPFEKLILMGLLPTVQKRPGMWVPMIQIRGGFMICMEMCGSG